MKTFSKTSINAEILKSDFAKIFILCSSIFCFISMVQLYYALNGEPLVAVINRCFPYLAISQKASVTWYSPWVIFTHAFTEYSFMRLLSQLFWLSVFGFILEDLKGRNSMLPLFIVSTVLSGLLIALISIWQPQLLTQNYYYGLQAPLFAVITASVFFRPTYKIFPMLFGGIAAWKVALVFLLLNVATQAQLSPLYFLVLLFCFLIGVLYNYTFSGFFTMLQNKLNGIDNNFIESKNFISINKNTTLNKKENSTFTVIDISEHKLNKILDKINEKGIDALSPSEKEWLEVYSHKTK